MCTKLLWGSLQHHHFDHYNKKIKNKTKGRNLKNKKQKATVVHFGFVTHFVDGDGTTVVLDKEREIEYILHRLSFDQTAARTTAQREVGIRGSSVRLLLLTRFSGEHYGNCLLYKSTIKRKVEYPLYRLISRPNGNAQNSTAGGGNVRNEFFPRYSLFWTKDDEDKHSAVGAHDTKLRAAESDRYLDEGSRCQAAAEKNNK